MNEKNIYAKIQQSRVDVLGEIKKDTQGYGYNYFSNDNILPVANEILNRNGLCPVFKIEKRYEDGTIVTVNNSSTMTETETKERKGEYWGVLTIINIDNPEQREKYEMPTCLAAIKGTSAVQNYGGMATFTKRYLYLSFLEIADGSDKEVEATSDKAKKGEKTAVPKLTDKQKELITSKASEDDLKGILEFYSVKSIDELNAVQASDCLKRLG